MTTTTGWIGGPTGWRARWTLTNDMLPTFVLHVEPWDVDADMSWVAATMSVLVEFKAIDRERWSWWKTGDGVMEFRMRVINEERVRTFTSFAEVPAP